ncbi:class A beta-lactamase [Bosea sp. 117]|uniref:class A beta-lactamase n=1 Tax=Bosea sp. 117 TaxID=1125973 RepID=UPI000493BAFE|nr:class A beta-lactamase [Bosea sp. 117]
MRIARRDFAFALTGLAAGTLLLRPGAARAAQSSQTGTREALTASLRGIEAKTGGRLGVALIDGTDGAVEGYREAERFPMCSTFKALAAAAVLARVDAGSERIDRVVRYTRADLVTYSPAAEKHVDDGMTLDALCEAAVTLSDNTAGNLLLKAIGGPAGLTAYARSLGDRLTRLDRWETALNEAAPGDERDTTTPAAMAGNLRRLVLGDALQPASRARLTGWLVGNKTGDTRLRAGVPGDWRVGDKTGTGENGTANDVGIAWPPRRAPLVVAIYLTQSRGDAASRNAAIAEAARAIAVSQGA